jgi:alpha-1,2-mannosyltransferase
MTKDQWAVVAALVVALSLGLVNAFRYGADFFDMLLGGQRLLAGTNLYEGSGPAFGMIGPPAQALLLAPFAALAEIDLVLSRACWFALNFAGLVFGVRAWRTGLGLTGSTWWLVLAAGCAVAFPLYREFQAQNMTLVVFWLTGVAAAHLVAGNDTRAGTALGIATALKLFPGLAIIYLLTRARWTALRAAMISTAAIGLLPVIRFGPTGFIELVREWLRTRTTGDWPIWNQNQSLSTTIGRDIPGDLGVVLGTVMFAALVAGVAWLGWRRRASPTTTLGDELALAIGVSVMASPIAWVSYWLLFMPLFMVVGRQATLNPLPARAVFIVAAILISVVDTWRRSAPGAELLAAALLLIAAVAVSLPRERMHAA